jgi:retron-type reverse transcriptase
VPFERYADDVIAHCRTEKQAQEMKKAIAERLQSCGLELHGSGRQGCKSRKVKDLLPSIA